MWFCLQRSFTVEERLLICDDLSQRRNNVFLFATIFQGGGILIFALV